MLKKSSRLISQSLRGIGSMALVLAFLLNCISLANAGTTGVLSGTVKEPNGTPVANVVVTAVAISGRYSTTTNAAGFYAITGVPSDSYSVSFTKSGYEAFTANNVNVFADQTLTENATLARSLQVIGRVTARSAGGAYQPTQTQDTYTVTANQIQTVLGKPAATNEVQLLTSLPGASLDSSGYPVLRGGRENEEGFQFEGIDYTDAFTSQFVNALSLPAGGVQSLQLTPGAGDASIGNAGTGTINLISKRGAYPAFGQIDLEATAPQFGHQLNMDYGFASPNGRFSDYINFTGQRNSRRAGYGASAASIGTYFGRTYSFGNEVTNNMVYKFGHNNNQQFQFFYDNSQYLLYQNNGGIDTLCFKTCDPLFLATAGPPLGLSDGQIQSVIPLVGDQQSVVQRLNRRSAYHEPNETIKLQYSNNINSSTFFTIRGYSVNSTTTFDWPYISNSPFANSFVLDQGGVRHGIAADLTKQLSEKHLIQAGGKYEFLHPVYDQPDNIYGFYALSLFGSGAEVYDFLPNDANCPNVLSDGVTTNCGYLASQGIAPGTRLPDSIEQSVTNRQDFAGYIQDTWSPNSRLKVTAGLRMDAANYRLPAPVVDPKTCTFLYLPSKAFTPNTNLTDPCPQVTFDVGNDKIRPRILEPRLALAYQMGPKDSVRFSYGRSVEFPPLGFVDLNGARSDNFYAPYINIPSYNSVSGVAFDPTNPNATAATYCGVLGNQVCKNYAEQLRWENQNAIFGVPIQPVKPETFNNFDFSYSHQFKNNVGVKVTPFYRRGYDATALVATARLDKSGNAILDANGAPVLNPPVATNLGINRTTGVEFLLTKEAEYGFSGQVSATYINELSNVIPTSASEDFFPSIPPESLALGNVYRVGFLSPFQANVSAQYRTRSGFRINPIVTFDVGYPIGSGLITAYSVNGKPYNLPNTNVTIPGALGGSTSATRYVDPQNPGSVFAPNIAATRGFAEANSAGGKLSGPESYTSLTLEYTPPRATRSTFGVLIGNLFGQLYSGPGLNTRYQPLATGISGPLSGQNKNSVLFPQLGFANFGANRRGQQAFLDTPNNTGTSYRFYYIIKL